MNTKTTLSNFTTRVAMTLVVLLFSSLYAWADLSGRCGTNLWFNFHPSSNTVDIYIGTEGTTGYMTNYNQADQVPWKSVRGTNRESHHRRGRDRYRELCFLWLFSPENRRDCQHSDQHRKQCVPELYKYGIH